MMEIQLYQINGDRDTKNVMFMNMDFLRSRNENAHIIDSSIYDLVFEGQVDCNNLEEVYELFDEHRVEDFNGRSMSVSDVVVVKDPDGTDHAHFCDSIGFKDVEFEVGALEKDERYITVVMLEPGKEARIAKIGSSLEAMQEAVGGYIEAVYPFEDTVCIVCNEKGKIDGLPLNRALYEEPEQVEMSYADMTSFFRQEESKGKHALGYIVFSQDSFSEPYSELSRTYRVSSDNKAFQEGMGGYSIYGSCLDGSDPIVRLEAYMASEHGGKDGWKIERCYIENDPREMMDILAGSCFICDCSGENFGSLSEGQQHFY